MPYATKQDLIDRFGADELIELTDRADPPAGEIDDAVLGEVQDTADALIDSHLLERYAVPVSPVPDLLVAVAADIARYRLYKDNPPEVVTDRHKAAMKTLGDLARGIITIDATAATQPSSGGSVQISAPDRVFTAETLEGF